MLFVMSSLSQNSQQNSQPLVSRLVNRTTLVFLCVLEELGLPLAEVRSVEPVRQVYSRSSMASCGRAGTSYGPVSATSRGSIETNERIDLGFGMEAFFHLSYTVS